MVSIVVVVVSWFEPPNIMFKVDRLDEDMVGTMLEEFTRVELLVLLDGFFGAALVGKVLCCGDEDVLLCTKGTKH